MNKNFKVAVAGAGAMGKQHIKSWQASGHQVVSVTDVNLEQAQKKAKEFGITNVYTDYKQAISQPEVDIVSIALPLALHAPVTIFAAEQGKHVMCEKAMCGSVKEAQAMEKAIDKAGVQFAVNYQHNQSLETQLIKKWVGENRFGTPLMVKREGLVDVRPKSAMHDYYGNQGPIMDKTSHHIIFYQDIFQCRAKKVFATGTVFANKDDYPHISHIEKLAYDTASMSIEYESGDIVNESVSWGLWTGFKMKKGPDYIVGPKGGAEMYIRDKVVVYDKDQEGESISTVSAKTLHQLHFEVFADALENNKPVPIGIKEGKEALAVVLALFKSIETGEAVTVDYDF